MERMKEILRWAVIVAFGGGGAMFPVQITVGAFAARQWSGLIVLLVVVPLCLPLMLVSYYTHVRKYRKVRDILAVIGAVVVGAILLQVPQRKELREHFQATMVHITASGPLTLEEAETQVLTGLAQAIAAIFCLIAPFWAAGIFYRIFRKVTDRYLEPDPAAVAAIIARS
jgi:cytochrome bd-type quinol oxidase subunit 2